MRYALAILCVSVASAAATAADIDFEGIPTVKIEMLEGTVQTQTVPTQRAREFAVRVAKTSSGYAWASRNNVPLVKYESGAYITYVATNGAGYVRVYNPEMRKALNSLPKEQREKEFAYMEHMVNQSGSITYFGK